MKKKAIDQVIKELGLKDKPTPHIFEDLLAIASKKRTEEKYINKVNFDGDHLQLIPIGDPHLGAIHCDLELLQRTVDYILADKHRYTIFMGDLAETATKVSVGKSVYEEDKHLREQLYTLRDMMMPLAEQGRILGIHQGNHEFRSAMLTSLCPMEILSELLRVPYLEYQGYTILTVGSQRYSIMSYHGAGGGGSTGAKANATERGFKVNPTCDIYLSGHTHAKSAHETVSMIIDENDQMVSKVQKYVSCGSFLNYFGGYAEMKVLQPAPLGAPIIDFCGTQKCISVRI